MPRRCSTVAPADGSTCWLHTDDSRIIAQPKFLSRSTPFLSEMTYAGSMDANVHARGH